MPDTVQDASNLHTRDVRRGENETHQPRAQTRRTSKFHQYFQTTSDAIVGLLTKPMKSHFLRFDTGDPYPSDARITGNYSSVHGHTAIKNAGEVCLAQKCYERL